MHFFIINLNGISLCNSGQAGSVPCSMLPQRESLDQCFSLIKFSLYSYPNNVHSCFLANTGHISQTLHRICFIAWDIRKIGMTNDCWSVNHTGGSIEILGDKEYFGHKIF